MGATVKFGDLDLNTDAGRRELLERLSRAASRVCEQYANALWALGYYQIYSSCLRNSLAAAVNKVHDAQVSALLAATDSPGASRDNPRWQRSRSHGRLSPALMR